MATLDSTSPAQAGTASGELLELELQVARRADELAAGTSGGRDADRHIWLVAENDVSLRLYFEHVAESTPTGTRT